MKFCAQHHNFAYEQCVRPAEDSEPLFFGTLIHRGIELLDSGKTVDEVHVAIESVFADKLQWPDKLVVYYKVCALLAGYAWRWAADEIEVIASEIEFELPLRNPETNAATPLWLFAGKIDKIVRLPDGRIAVQEIKTSGESIADDADYWRVLAIDEQISGYVLSARELGYDISTVWYDVIRKPEIAPRNPTYQLNAEEKNALQGGVYFGATIPLEEVQAAIEAKKESPRMYGARLMADIYERPDFYYARREIPRLTNDLEEYQFDRWNMAQMIRESQRHARWPRNTRSCLGRGKCEYFDSLCSNGVRAVGEIPSRFIRLNTPHPELKGKSLEYHAAAAS